MSNTPIITVTGARLSVTAPYNSDFVAEAERLGGKWEPPAWRFDARDEQRIRNICRDVYGSDGFTADLVTLRVEWHRKSYADKGPIEIRGRTIARAFGRDSGAKLGDGIILLDGGFGSGGSVKNWETTVKDGTVVLVRDFPRAAAEKLVDEQPDEGLKSYAIEDEAAPVDREALGAERSRLLGRVAEINRLLGE